MALEIEVKFILRDLAAFRERLVTVGAVVKKARVYERNVRYDTPWESLRRRQAILRLRQDTRARVTYKGVPENFDLSQTEARVREEVEFEVSDFDAADLLIRRIGYQPQQEYDKYRETFQLGAVEIVLDEMPYGDFVELEGSEAEIRACADLLGLRWERRLTINYLGLFNELRQLHDLTFNNLTFAAFDGCHARVADLEQYTFGD